ncbi:MAG: hypothetical protein ACXWEG_12450 [Actinomycetota bacterium]
MRHGRMITVASLALVLAGGCGGGTDGGAANGASASRATPTPASPSPTLAPVERSPIDGAYAMTLTRHDVLAAGLRASTASDIAGVWRVTFDLEYAQQFVDLGGITADGYQGDFSVDGHRLILTDEPTLAFEWRFANKQLTLSLVDEASVDPVDALIWTAHPWRLTGR